jgi:hypothetical protein
MLARSTGNVYIDIYILILLSLPSIISYIILEESEIYHIHLNICIGILGPFPSSVLAAGKETIKYFTLSNVVYEKTEAEDGEIGANC